MKCSKCGHRSNTIAAMAKHYRQKHPSSLKRKTSKTKKRGSYCPTCGRAR